QGPHTVQAHEINAAGNIDATPASRTWTVDTVAPDMTIAGPSGSISATGVAFVVFATEAGATFQVSLDGGAFVTATNPASFLNLAQGVHTLQARAIDAAGNIEPTPASQTWTVDTVVPDTTIAGPSGSISATSAAFVLSAP